MLHKNTWNSSGRCFYLLKVEMDGLFAAFNYKSIYLDGIYTLATNFRITELWTYFTPCCSASIVNFEHVIAGWENFSEYLEMIGFPKLHLGACQISEKELSCENSYWLKTVNLFQ